MNKKFGRIGAAVASTLLVGVVVGTPSSASAAVRYKKVATISDRTACAQYGGVPNGRDMCVRPSTNGTGTYTQVAGAARYARSNYGSAAFPVEASATTWAIYIDTRA